MLRGCSGSSSMGSAASTGSRSPRRSQQDGFFFDGFFFSRCFDHGWLWLDDGFRLRLGSGSMSISITARVAARPFALAQPLGLIEQHAEALRCWLHLERVFVRVHALREHHTEALDPHLHQLLRKRAGGFVARLVAVVGDVHALGAVLLEGRAMVGCEAVHAITGRHVADSPRSRTSARRSAIRTG